MSGDGGRGQRWLDTVSANVVSAALLLAPTVFGRLALPRTTEGRILLAMSLAGAATVLVGVFTSYLYRQGMTSTRRAVFMVQGGTLVVVVLGTILWGMAERQYCQSHPWDVTVCAPAEQG